MIDQQLDLGVVAGHLRDVAVAHTVGAAVAGPEAAKPALEEEQANDRAGDDMIASAGVGSMRNCRFTISSDRCAPSKKPAPLTGDKGVDDQPAGVIAGVGGHRP